MMESIEKLREAFEKCTYPIKDELIELDTVWIPKAIAMMMLDDIEEEIVRCRDCVSFCDGIINGKRYSEPYCGAIGELAYGALFEVDEDCFCSWAERKEDGDD